MKKQIINPRQLASIISEKRKDLNKQEVEEMIKIISQEISEQLHKNVAVKLTSFGIFETRSRHERNGVNPRKPSEKIKVPEVRVVKFKAAQKLKEKIKTKRTS